ncbi:hypothetical protein TNCV_1966161 [Trichonephila clavipes]|nr:hypothetical protein TNCV_1966161 [Trichonephila clavipes]
MFQALPFAAQERPFLSLCYIGKGMRSNVHRSNASPRCSKRPRTVRADIVRSENMSIFCLMVRDVVWLVESFFKNDEDHNITVNGDRYRAMITNFFIPESNNPDVQELWFQQDGTTCHTARATINLLKDTFGDRLISRLDL